jgi:hypothetical protein
MPAARSAAPRPIGSPSGSATPGCSDASKQEIESPVLIRSEPDFDPNKKGRPKTALLSFGSAYLGASLSLFALLDFFVFFLVILLLDGVPLLIVSPLWVAGAVLPGAGAWAKAAVDERKASAVAATISLRMSSVSQVGGL